MGKMVRQAPNPEWVLMYRSGLSRARIAKLVGAPASRVGYHLSVAKDLDPGLVKEHEATRRVPNPKVTRRGVECMDELIEFVSTQGRYPSSKAPSTAERSLAIWLGRRRRQLAAGTLAPAFIEGLKALPGWETRTRTLSDEARWHERLATLVEYRATGGDWPLHKKSAVKEEHALGVWLHIQRIKQSGGELDDARASALDAALPGWRAGRKRGRKRSRNNTAIVAALADLP